MDHYLRHFILWITFVVLLPLGFLSLGDIEGDKVAVGLMPSNLWILIEGIGFSVIIYPVTFFLLSIFFRKFLNHAYVKVILYFVVSGAIGGLFIYSIVFPRVWEQRYGLSVVPAILIFGAIGLIYAFVDIYTNSKLKSGSQINKGVKLILIIICLASLTIIGYHTYSKYTYNMHTNEQGILYKKVISPNKNYIAKAYGFPYGGAAGGVNVRVDIVSTTRHYKKTIYYSHLYSNFNMRWLNNKTLHIENKSGSLKDPNRSITLNVFKQIYDEKGTACVSLVMKGKYKKCYQY